MSDYGEPLWIDDDGVIRTSGGGVFDHPDDRARIVACVNACDGIDDPAALRQGRDALAVRNREHEERYEALEARCGLAERERDRWKSAAIADLTEARAEIARLRESRDRAAEMARALISDAEIAWKLGPDVHEALGNRPDKG